MWRHTNPAQNIPKSHIKRIITHANQKQIKSFLERGSLENKWFVQSPVQANISTMVPKRRHVCAVCAVCAQGQLVQNRLHVLKNFELFSSELLYSKIQQYFFLKKKNIYHCKENITATDKL